MHSWPKWYRSNVVFSGNHTWSHTVSICTSLAAVWSRCLHCMVSRFLCYVVFPPLAISKQSVGDTVRQYKYFAPHQTPPHIYHSFWFFPKPVFTSLYMLQNGGFFSSHSSSTVNSLHSILRKAYPHYSYLLSTCIIIHCP